MFDRIVAGLLLSVCSGFGCSRVGVTEPAPTRTTSTAVPAEVRAPAPIPSSSAAPAPAVTSVAPAPSASAVSLREPDPEGMKYVPGGEFTMGQDQGGEEDEHPAHRVKVKGFFLDTLEVTVTDYMECVKAGACRMYREDAAQLFHAGDDARFRGPRQPISGVSHDDATAYCAFRNKRLPTEAEWERAASGDDRRRYVWGNESPDPTRHGCFMRAVGPKGQTTCDVGSFPEGQGPYGHLDLAGNVWEWCADDYDPYAYRRPTAGEGKPGTCEDIKKAQDEIRNAGLRNFTGTNPVPTTCEKVLRGGAFNYPGPGMRVTNRVHHPGAWRILVAGFRCARDEGT